MLSSEIRADLKARIDAIRRERILIVETGECRDCGGPRGHSRKGRRCHACYLSHRREQKQLKGASW